MENIVTLMMGDPSSDGHGRSEEIDVKTNYPVELLQQAYKDSCKLTGVSFNHNNNFTGLKLSHSEEQDRLICVDYQDNTIPELALEILEQHGLSDEFLSKDRHFDGADHLAETIMRFIGLSMPEDFEFKLVENSKIYLNGWGNLNVQFGYGLYY